MTENLNKYFESMRTDVQKKICPTKKASFT